MKNTQTTRKLRAGTALQALALIGTGLGMSAAIVAPAAAQDYTSGAITGTVSDDSGTVAGATVTVTSTEQGFSRTTTTSAGGTFRFTALAQGSYDVTVTAEGKPSWKAEGVAVQSSQTASLDIMLSSAEDIVVTGSSIQQAFSGTTTGLNVDVADFAKTKPIGRNLTSVILLAPGTTQGDSAFGNLAAIGGSSVAENAYYINGLNITNFDNYVGSATVPFEFYRNVEVKSGGYPAEFGRATGGIINAVTKSGSNDFTAALHLNWEPNFLRDHAPNIQSCSVTTAGQRAAGAGPVNCVNTTNRSRDTAEAYSAIVEAGGPIIKDRLFVYGLAEFRRTKSLTTSPLNNQALQDINDDPFWGVKVDAYPLDSQHLEFTIFDTRSTTNRNVLTYADATGAVGGASSVIGFPQGGVNWVGKYTGQFTDWLSVSAAYGIMRDRFLTTGGSSAPYVANSSGGTVNGVANGARLTPQTAQLIDFPYDTQRKFFRADADIFFHLLGDHHIRGGYDQEKNTLNHVSIVTGGDYEFANNMITAAAYNAGLGGGGARYILRPGGIVEVNYYNTGGSFGAKNVAYYLQDEWKVTDRLTVNLGVRRDDFGVDKADGTPLVRLDKNYAPRLGATYNLWGDNSGKVYGSYSWYYLPVASNTAYRQASSEYYFNEYYNYSGFNSAGVPLISSLVTNNPAHQGNCPILLTPLSTGHFCSVTGDGTSPDTGAAISHNLKATRESEWIVGYEQKFDDWKFGLSYTHRNLDRSAEDMAIDAAVVKYCQANGIAGCSNTWYGYNQYVITNPGSDVVVNLRGLDGREVTFKAADLGYPKAKRTYDAIEFTFDKAWNGSYAFGGSYTWSKSKGNSEGFVQSDFGQDDSGITQDFDQPGFIPGAYGYLPNDRRHQIKLYGSVALNDDFTLGANARVYSPRPLSCFGFSPGQDPYNSGPYTDFANGYTSAAHYCNSGSPIGTVTTGTGANAITQNVYGSALSPRGTAQKTDWLSQIDVSARYNVHFGDRLVTLRADVFNLLNSRAVTKRNETGDSGLQATPGVTRNVNYGLVTAYQSPRYVRLGLDIAF